MKRWGMFVSARPWTVVIATTLVLVAAAAYGFGVFGYLKNGGFDDSASQSYRAAEIERDVFGDRSADVVAIYRSSDGRITDPENQNAVERLVADLPAEAVEKVTPYYAAPPEAGLIGDDGRAGMVVVTLSGESQDDKSDAYLEVKDALAAPAPIETELAGAWPVFGDINDTAGADIARAEMIALPIVFLLSLVIFGGVVAALMPTMIGAVAVVGAFAVLRLLGLGTDISVFALNVVTLLGMGLAIDYALFIVTRFREEAAAEPDRSRASSARAAVRTLRTAGRTVLFSGLVVAASLASLLIFPQMFLRSMGLGGIAAVVLAMTASLTLLPAVLVLLGRRLDAGRLPFVRRGHGGFWGRIASAVMRRPIAVLVSTLGVLVVLGIPFYSVSWGGVDSHMLPDSAPAVQAMKHQQDWFGGETSTASVVLTGPGAADAGALSSYVESVRELPGEPTAQIVDRRGAGEDAAALIDVSWSGGSQDDAAQNLVRDLRDVEPQDARALVGGATAETVDMLDSIGDRLPIMAAIVIAVMGLLLFLAFGSVLLPVKAVLVNAFSLLASFGVVTWIFADGHFEGLLGFTSPGYLDATQPILMLGILFGLSMDYEVFLLSRIAEEWEVTGDNTGSVAAGLQRTGGLITAAALLLMVVIGGFATSGLVFIKMIGIGMFVAILIDATVVRLLLVPAAMRLMGRWNWWAPKPLRTLADRFGMSHVERPEPEPTPIRG